MPYAIMLMYQDRMVIHKAAARNDEKLGKIYSGYMRFCIPPLPKLSECFITLGWFYSLSTG